MTALAAEEPRRDPEPIVRLAAQHAYVDARDAAEAALRDAGDWLGEPLDSSDLPPGWRRFLVDMRLPIGEGRRLSFHKAAFVELGPLVRRSAATTAEIGWYAAGLQPLFPVFAGRLRLADGELGLQGCYAPPGGSLGVIADRLLLHLAASGTARWLLAELAAATEAGGSR